MAFSVIKTSDCNYKNVASHRRFEMFLQNGEYNNKTQ